MVTKKQSAFIVIAVIALTGCTAKAPDCNDSKTKSLVLSIENDFLKETFDTKGEFFKAQIESMGMGLTFDNNFSSMKLLLEDVRTTDYNDKTGKYSCSGNLVVRDGKNDAKVPIGFTSELADGDKPYVQASKPSDEDQGELIGFALTKPK